jgi:hypothetical protein
LSKEPVVSIFRTALYREDGNSNSSETLIHIYQVTRRHIPYNVLLIINLKSLIIFCPSGLYKRVHRQVGVNVLQRLTAPILRVDVESGSSKFFLNIQTMRFCNSRHSNFMHDSNFMLSLLLL